MKEKLRRADPDPRRCLSLPHALPRELFGGVEAVQRLSAMARTPREDFCQDYEAIKLQESRLLRVIQPVGARAPALKSEAGQWRSISPTPMASLANTLPRGTRPRWNFRRRVRGWKACMSPMCVSSGGRLHGTVGGAAPFAGRQERRHPRCATCGVGASGRNGRPGGLGQRRGQDELEKALGHKQGALLWDLGEEAKALVRQPRRKTHDIACDNRAGIIHADHKPQFAAAQPRLCAAAEFE